MQHMYGAHNLLDHGGRGVTLPRHTHSNNSFAVRSSSDKRMTSARAASKSLACAFNFAALTHNSHKLMALIATGSTDALTENAIRLVRPASPLHSTVPWKAGASLREQSMLVELSSLPPASCLT
eukprot:1360102-Amphidinium_carterae.1